MWPTLLNLTHDECRRTLRRLELDAYSNIINVFRAQGALGDNRKKLLEELRAVLHISTARHNAEARRVSNDELLATIAEQLTGPNTNLGWVCEGRRIVPLMPRGVAQTVYTDIADNIGEKAESENNELEKKLEAEQLAAPHSNEDELTDTEGLTAEATDMDDPMDEMLYPPIAMEDQTAKLWETVLTSRKRKIPEGGGVPDEVSKPMKNMRNIPVNTNQKHLNLSQIYSKYSQPATSKSSSQSKHSYNQVSKVSTSKSSQHPPRATPHKHRSHRQNSKNPTQTASKPHKKSQEITMSPNKQYNPASMHLEYSGAPTTFQASYAQSILGGKSKTDYMDDLKTKVLSSPGMVTDSPTMQLLTQPATVPHELGVSDNTHLDDHISLQAQSTPIKKANPTKPCHLIIKKRNEVTHATEKKVQMPEFKILQKSDGVKVISSRQVVVAQSPSQKVINSASKIGTTKVIGSIPKTRTSNTPILSEKMIVVSKPSGDSRVMSNSKLIVTSSAVSTPNKDVIPVSTNSILPKISEALTPKGIPATDLKVSAKTFVLNQKSGQKMVVLPAKNRSKQGNDGQMPLLHFKGIPTAMKLVPVSSQATSQAVKTSSVTVMSRPASINTIPSKTKIVSVETIKTANLADIVPVKGLAPAITPKISNPIVRPGSAKGSLIVVQKGTTIGKTLTFTKNGNDTKIIMGKNVNQLLQATKPDQAETSKCAGNVIVLELNNEQTGRTTTMSEILDSRNTGASRVHEHGKQMTHQEITQDTPVLFDSQLTEETCNANSLDSTNESLGDIVPMEDATLRIIDKDDVKTNMMKGVDGGKDSSSVTDWEMELDTVSKKGKDDDDKLNSLHLDLGMSSDSDNEFMVDGGCQQTHSSQESIPRSSASGRNDEIFSSTRGFSLATRTLLSQLQDDGSSSNDSSFALKSKCIDKTKKIDKIDKSESDALFEAKEKLTEKVAEATSRQKRIDIYSTAITTTDINLDSFSYLDESMMVGDDVFGTESKRDARRSMGLDDQLSRLLGEDSANSTDSQTVSESLPLNK